MTGSGTERVSERERMAGARAGRRGESGQALIMVAVSSFVLFAFVAMGVDMGYMRYRKSMMQTAADAGALAGASALQYAGDWRATARADTSRNGFTNGTSGVSVIVNRPPASGPHTTNAAYVEVIVSQSQQTFFARALSVASVPLSARGVAFLGASGKDCIYVLNPNGAGAMTVTGTASLTVGCGIVVDSTSGTALRVVGTSSVTAAAVGVDGGYTGGGTITPTPVTGIVPVPDPLAYLPQPAVGPCDFTLLGPIVVDTILSPGVYCGGIQISSTANVIFLPGVYILNGGGLTYDGNGTLTGAGVMFFNTGTAVTYGPIDLRGNGIVTLSAPTSGTYAGILFFQDRTLPLAVTLAPPNTNRLAGGTGSTYTGTLYFPTSRLDYTGNSSVDGYTVFVSYDLTISGTSNVSSNYSTLPNNTSPIKVATLVE